MSNHYPLPPGSVILGVQPGYTQKNQPKFDVQCSDNQTYTTFRPEVASKAQNAVQQQGITIMVSRNGKYLNFEDVISGAPPQGQASFVPASAQPQVFTPAPSFDDKKDIEIRRSVALKAAVEIIAALANTGYYLTDEGVLNHDLVASDTFALTASYGKYLANGPNATAPASAAPEAPPLPQGVSADQVAAWAQAQGGAVQVGAPVAVEAPAPAPAEAAPVPSY